MDIWLWAVAALMAIAAAYTLARYELKHPTINRLPK